MTANAAATYPPRSSAAPNWTRNERILYLSSATVVCLLAYAYCFHMYRGIAFDEIGLHNPIYMYVTTGQITYPVHGQPNFMTVHPPTHYLLTALLIKAGLPLFKASAAPIFALTALIVALLYTGGFSFGSATGLLLALFLATFIWGELYTIRPDLMVTYLWIGGLVGLQAARNCAWSPWRLFLGSALSVSAACMHYWGIAAVAGVFVCCLVLLHERRWNIFRAAKPLAAIVLGALLVGVPFVVLFVVPRYPDIMEMVQGVQSRVGGSGGPIQAYQRHVESYAALAQRLDFDPWVQWLTSVLTAPVLDWRLPAVVIGAPLLALWRDVRLLAIAGAALPLFVLFCSQSKQIGYTGYLMPEMIIYLAGILLLVINIPARLFRSARQPVARVAAAIAVSLLAVMQVPTSMEGWTPGLDLLDVSRGAAASIVGPRAVIGMNSAGTWYTAGGRYVWNAFNELVDANRRKVDIAAYLQPIDALVIDGNTWNAAPEYAPVSSWYLQHFLHLNGFVLPTTSPTISNFLLFVAAKQAQVTGYFVGKDKVTKFSQAEQGDATVAVLSCPRSIDLSPLHTPFYKISFSYMPEPQKTSPHIVVLGFMNDGDSGKRFAADWDCSVRDSVRGTLTEAARDELNRAGLAAYEDKMLFYQSRYEALATQVHPLASATDLSWSVVDELGRLEGAPLARFVSSMPIEGQEVFLSTAVAPVMRNRLYEISFDLALRSGESFSMSKTRLQANCCVSTGEPNGRTYFRRSLLLKVARLRNYSYGLSRIIRRPPAWT